MTATGVRQKDLFASSGERVYTVSELASGVRSLLEDTFGLVRVIGEISSLSLASSGHAYFSLKDENASLPAVIFRSAVARIGGEVPAEGTEVECLGRLTLYEPRGRTQLVVEWMVPRGAGALGLQFLQRKEKLAAEGLFDPERKRPIPFLPGRIGIVTSPTGAAVRDILKVLARRFPSVPVLICPVRVQGEGAAEEIAAAIERMGDGKHCDVLIAGRGGGSLEDLWAFNEEVVVRAVAASKVPVISAVGHEVDLVLSDLAADVRAPTPTAAAELVVPDRRELLDHLDERVKDLRRVLKLCVSTARHRLLDTARRIRDPRRVLDAYRLRLDEAQRTAVSRVTLEVERRRTRLQGQIGALSSLNPLAVLERGYGVVSRPDGETVRKSAQVSAGDSIHVRLHQGSLDGTVTRVHSGPEKK
jgi:exodeoxyribonuclease VII large subunit